MYVYGKPSSDEKLTSAIVVSTENVVCQYKKKNMDITHHQQIEHLKSWHTTDADGLLEYQWMLWSWHTRSQ